MSGNSPSGFSAVDSAFMAEALQLAARGRYTAHPNPRVGCVLVRDGEVVGRGWHRRAGGAHAEVVAIEDAGDKARGAIAYVNLEPCSHHGKTPPCSAALIAAGVQQVVCAMRDPNPRVAGAGIKHLESAGIRVRVGLMRSDAEALNRGFVSRIENGRPFVRLKMAASLDGATAMSNGESQWITGPEARVDVQRFRAESGAIMTGIGTVLADDPSLTVRNVDLTAVQPLRVIIDSQLRTPPSACMLDLDGTTLIFCADSSEKNLLEKSGVDIRHCAGPDGRVDLNKALAELGQREINDLLVEAGPMLAGSLLTQGLVDELVIYQAPHIMGSETRNMFTTPAWTSLADRAQLKITDVRKIGSDTRITATPYRTGH